MNKKLTEKKMGRPRIARKHALNNVFSARLRDDEAKLISHSIDASDQSRSDWIRDALLEKARKG